MTERPSWDQIYSQMAKFLSWRSTCRRLKVGTVIVSMDNRHVLGIGYNGNAAGFPNDCDCDTPGACGCIHSEENAIINCTAPRETPKKVYITHVPCKMCAKKLVNLGGVQEVIYVTMYRNTEGLEILDQAGIKSRRSKGCLVVKDRSSR